MALFLSLDMPPKFRNVYFLETKAPAGAPLTERSFSKLTQIKLIHLKEISKTDIFQKSGFLMVFYQSKSIFYRKLKWSVWSIWIYFKGYLSKFQWKKLSFWQKLIFWKMTMSKILGMCIFGEKRRLRHAPQTENSF